MNTKTTQLGDHIDLGSLATSDNACPSVDEMLSDQCNSPSWIKFYSKPQMDEISYSPARMVEAMPVVMSGVPDPAKICASDVRAAKLTMRVQIRRLTRLTNAFSKKLQNHKAAVALHFAYCNFCRLHDAKDGSGDYGSSLEYSRTAELELLRYQRTVK